MTKAFGEGIHRLVALYGEQFGYTFFDVLFCLVKFRQVGRYRTCVYLVRQIVSYRIRKYVVTVGQTLHQRGGAKTVCSVIGEVAFAYCVASFDRSHQFIVDPEAAQLCSVRQGISS